MISLSRCPVCEAPAATTKKVRKHLAVHNGATLETTLYECACGHVFSNPQPDVEELSPFYDESYHVFNDAQISPEELERAVAEARPEGRFNHVSVVPGGRFLDVGCGLGSMVGAMSLLGMDSEGVEPSAIAAKTAARFERPIFCGTLEEAQYADASFDRISMIHVLEHVYDPVALLRECLRILKPGGELVVGVPNYDAIMHRMVGDMWSGLDLPRHLHHFRHTSLSGAAYRAGLTLTSIETESLTPHVEAVLAKWLRQRMLIPFRMTIATHITRPLAAYLANLGNRSHRGEAIVMRCKRAS